MERLCAGTDQSSGQGQTEQQQTDYYKQVYASVESSINSGGPIKGIAFWRWAEAASPTTGLASFDTSATLRKLPSHSTCMPDSSTCRHILATCSFLTTALKWGKGMSAQKHDASHNVCSEAET